MCIALVLIMNNFYKVYDSVLEYCEHLTAAFLLLVVVLMIFLPMLIMMLENSADHDESNDRAPMITIIVLVCGVVVGLVVVIAFVFFCKKCFHKKVPPKQQNQSPGMRRLQVQRGKKESLAYKGIPKPLGVTPVPVDLESYLQQPINNNSQIGDYASMGNTHLLNTFAKGKLPLETEEFIVIETSQLVGADLNKDVIIVEDETRKPEKECNKVSREEEDIQNVVSLKVPDVRARAHSESYDSKKAMNSTLGLPEEDQPRRGSWDERTRRQLPKITNEMEAQRRRSSVKYIDRKMTYTEPITLPKSYQSISFESSPVAVLPKSHQLVVERTSPPPEARRFVRANADEWRMRKGQLSILKSNRMAYSLSQSHQSTGGPSEMSAHSLQSNITRCNPFDQTALYNPQELYYGSAITTSSSSGSGRIIVSSCIPTLSSANPYRQVKSMEYDSNILGPPLSAYHRPGKSFDSSLTTKDPCLSCSQDALNRLQILRGESLPAQNLEFNRKSSLLRQVRLDEADLMADNITIDPSSHQLKQACHQLWGLRKNLEDNDDEAEIPDILLPEDEGGESPLELCSYTTSFESNTDATHDDYGDLSRPNTNSMGPFLQPPKLSVEAKRQKYKNLFTRRQWELLQQEISIENSFESFETHSSESSRHGIISLQSFESNQEEQTATDSTVDSQGRKRMGEMKGDSGYKSCSTEVPHLTQPHSLDKITQMPSVDEPLPLFLHQPSTIKSRYENEGEDIAMAAFQQAIEGGGSFEETAGIVPIGGLPVLPRNAHLERIRRKESSSTFYRHVPVRDFSIDSKSDAIYKEFVRFDPKLEVSPRSPRIRSAGHTRFISVDGGGGKQSSVDSIDEKVDRPFYYPNIPRIQLPDE